MTPDFWKKKKVFLTGHTGFKGSWLALWLEALGCEVKGYALDPPSEPNLFEAASVSKGIRSVHADIFDLAKLKKEITDFAPEIVIHLAAQSLVRESYKNPVETYRTNLLGTVHVMEAVRTSPSVRVAINVTTDKCYENRERAEGYREDEPMGGYDPYSSSKGCAELATAAYRNSFFNVKEFSKHRVGLASARAGNVIGGGDWAADRLVPDLMKAFTEKKKPLIRNPQATRPWQHVLEPLSGYLVLAEHLHRDGGAYAEGWNFGPDESGEKNVETVVKKLCALWGEGAGWTKDGSPHPHEATFLKLNCSKARQRLGWRPRLDLDTALAWVVEWTKAYAKKADMRQTTLEQIRRYMEKQP